MSKSKITFFVFLIISLVMALTIFADQETAEKVKCPVSGKEMKNSEAKAAHEYEGKIYYFCCENCKEKFLENPDKYVLQEAEPHEGHMHSHQQAEDTVVDPVCGMKIKKEEAKFTLQHDGKNYYFCMEECRDKFAKDPGKYVARDEEMVTCPVSGEEIEKSKAADSYEYEGKTYYFCCEGCKEKFLKDPEKYTKKK